MGLPKTPGTVTESVRDACRESGRDSLESFRNLLYGLQIPPNACGARPIAAIATESMRKRSPSKSWPSMAFLQPDSEVHILDHPRVQRSTCTAGYPNRCGTRTRSGSTLGCTSTSGATVGSRSRGSTGRRSRLGALNGDPASSIASTRAARVRRRGDPGGGSHLRVGPWRCVVSPWKRRGRAHRCRGASARRAHVRHGGSDPEGTRGSASSPWHRHARRRVRNVALRAGHHEVAVRRSFKPRSLDNSGIGAREPCGSVGGGPAARDPPRASQEATGRGLNVP